VRIGPGKRTRPAELALYPGWLHRSSFFLLAISHTDEMDDLETLRKLIGPDADGWIKAELEELNRDLDVMALLLLDMYRSRQRTAEPGSCGLPKG